MLMTDSCCCRKPTQYYKTNYPLIKKKKEPNSNHMQRIMDKAFEKYLDHYRKSEGVLPCCYAP